MSVSFRTPFPLAWTAAAAAALVTGSAAWAVNWGDWRAPSSIESMPGASGALNTPAVDGCPSLSPDGRELWFTSSRPGGAGGVDIWVARRSSTSQGFGTPENAGPAVNSSLNDSCPTMTESGRLYFTSQRGDPAGDLYVIRRTAKGWGDLTRLGPNINNPGSIEEAPSFYQDEQGRTVMYFSSSREGRNRVYYSVDGGPAQLAPGGVNSSAADSRPGVSSDGLEILWDSTRYGTIGGFDLWTARRSSTSESWGTARHLENLSSAGPGGFFQPGFDARPYLSQDGSTVVFGSFRDGGEGIVDMYVATRSRSSGN